MDRRAAVELAGYALYRDTMMCQHDVGMVSHVADVIQQVEKDTARRCAELADKDNHYYLGSLIRVEFGL